MDERLQKVVIPFLIGFASFSGVKRIMIGVVFLKNLHSICHGVACYPAHLLEELGIQKNVH